MIDTKEFYDYLIKKDCSFFVGVPDSLLKNLCACIKENAPKENNIITANEGNAIAIAAGYHMATNKYGVCYMQNSGLGNTVNPLLSLVDPDVYNIPMLLIIGWRGEPGVHDEPQHVKQGKVTLDLLKAMGIDFMILDNNYKDQLDKAYEMMKNENKVVALVVRKDSFTNYELHHEEGVYNLTREQSLSCIIDELDSDDFIVSTTGKTSREIFELRESKKMGHANDFLTVGSMGHTASIAFGMSLKTNKNIFCIDGDGSFLMHMGGFPIISQYAKNNFKYILINNGSHESVGGQPTVAFDINIEKILNGCGFTKILTAVNIDEIQTGIKRMKNNDLQVLIICTKQGSRKDLGRPTTTPVENKIALMNKLQG